MAKHPTTIVVLLVALRLATGWHFFNEGTKKLDPDFSSAGFLLGATGPLAPMYRGVVTGPHGLFEVLGVAHEQGSGDAEERAAADAWVADYGRRAAAAAKRGEPMPHDIDRYARGAEVVANIDSSWQSGLARVARLTGDDEALASIEALRDAKLGEVVNYLHSIQSDIADNQHELWRLEQYKKKAGSDPAPFQEDRARELAGETWAAMRPWAAAIETIDASFQEEAGEIAAKAGASADRVRGALTERSTLRRIDGVVTCLVIGAGVCLFFGLFTRVAAIVAAGFLLSVIASQPPWVADANSDYFFYQLVEVLALLLIAATAAGRWAGLDGLYLAARQRFGDLAPQNSTAASRS